MEEQPRDEQPKPDDEAEQAHHIDDGQSADAFLHELAEVRHQPMVKKVSRKKMTRNAFSVPENARRRSSAARGTGGR